MTTRDPLDYPWWLASRSAGIVAYLLLSAAVMIGLSLALRLGSPAVRRGLRATHERVALLALGAVAAHGLLLLADPWLKPGLTGVLVPFTADYRPVWTGIGVLAAYLAAGLSLSYYVRRRLGARRWRNAHRLVPIAWAMAAVHVVGAGTDAGSLWLQVPLAATASLILVFLAQRVWMARRERPDPAPAVEPVTVVAPPVVEHETPAPLWAGGVAPPVAEREPAAPLRADRRPDEGLWATRAPDEGLWATRAPDEGLWATRAPDEEPISYTRASAPR